ncbi:hypothetical protein K9M59_03595 [Candidatus Gracilibacteria bacterium]|nr:hypothetical protein [Candidatus Gracilibacteria bacterium]MCF7819408.1 hypothetical protein [Candidatus Gracilibacteria bacterium]
MKKKIRPLLFFFASFFLFFSFPAFAETTVIKTVYFPPIEVRTQLQGDILSAKAWLRSVDSEKIQSVIFQLFDGYGAEIFSEEVLWNNDFFVEDPRFPEKQMVVPFSYDFSQSQMSGVFELKALLKNKKNVFIAKGSNKFRYTASTPVTKIAELELDTEKQTMASFLAFFEGEGIQKVQPELTVRIQPQIDVFEHVSGGTLIASQKGTLQSISATKEQRIDIPFQMPDQPETYVVEVRLLDEEGKPLTGTLRRRLIIEGDFGEIQSFQSSPERFLEEGENITFSLQGMARRHPSPVQLKLTADQIVRGATQQTTVQQQEIVTVEDPNFSTEITIPVEAPGAEQFQVTIELLRNEKVIERKQFQTDLYLKYNSSWYKMYYGVMSDNLYLYLLVFITLLIFLGWWVHARISGKKMSLWILLPFLLLGSGAHAAWVNEWTYPQDGFSYNPSDTEGFQAIRFQGRIYDDEDHAGFFETYGPPSILEVELYDTSAVLQRTISIEPGEANFTSDEYIFEFDLPSDLPDEEYIPQVYIEKEPNSIRTDYSGTIFTDTTSPEIQFEYTPNTWSNTPIQVTITCPSDLTGCHPEPISPFQVQGNFCDDAEICETEYRGFEICDQVGNCSSTDTAKLTIDFYDPEPPTFDALKFLRDASHFLTGDGTGALEAHEIFDFLIENPLDPEETDQGVDTHACGPAEAGNDIYFKEASFCATKMLPCAESATERGSYNQQEGEVCTFTFPDPGDCNPYFFPLCIPFFVE